MKIQAETNVIITEVDDAMSALAIVEHGTNPVDFHRATMECGAKSNVAPIIEEPDEAESSNAGSSINTLCDIDAPQDARKLSHAVEVLALLQWSKDQATRLRDAGTALYEALPTIPSHEDPLVITLLLGGRLQPRLLVDEGLAVNILFKRAIADLNVEDRFDPPAFPIVVFGNNRITTVGVIELPVSFIDGDKIVNIAANFLIVEK